MKYIIVGLGNPGRTYAHTRHNVGFDALDLFAKKHRLRFRSSPFRALVSSYEYLGEEILLVKPQTFMNESGQAVGALARKHNITPDRLMVIYDDMDLPLGKLRIRPKGSAGGHNGMKSIISHMHSQDFPRMRVGIGHGGDAINHVLGRMSRKDRGVMDVALENTVDALEMFIEDGLEPAMNRFNRSEDD